MEYDTPIENNEDDLKTETVCHLRKGLGRVAYMAILGAKFCHHLREYRGTNLSAFPYKSDSLVTQTGHFTNTQREPHTSSVRGPPAGHRPRAFLIPLALRVTPLAQDSSTGR